MLPDSPLPATTDAPRAAPAAGIVLALLVLAAALAALLAWLLSARIGLASAPLAAAVATLLGGLPLALVFGGRLRRLEQRGPAPSQSHALDVDTGVVTRASFLAQAEREWARARRYNLGAALLVVEIDRFQRLCEQHGAGAGRAALAALAAHTGPTLRGGDSLGSFGSAQLAVWLAQADGLGALDAAERIRDRSETLDVPWQGRTLRLTVSVGVAALRPAHANLMTLVDDADAAVQAARQTGGNCVRAAPVDPTRWRKIGPSVGDNQAAGPV